MKFLRVFDTGSILYTCKIIQFRLYIESMDSAGLCYNQFKLNSYCLHSLLHPYLKETTKEEFQALEDYLINTCLISGGGILLLHEQYVLLCLRFPPGGSMLWNLMQGWVIFRQTVKTISLIIKAFSMDHLADKENFLWK